jgi:hypothetical protein
MQLTSEQVWQAIEKELFAVLGMVTAQGEARTVGIVYILRDRKLYIGTDQAAWKARHVAADPHVSITIPSPSAFSSFPGSRSRLPPSPLRAQLGSFRPAQRRLSCCRLCFASWTKTPHRSPTRALSK